MEESKKQSKRPGYQTADPNLYSITKEYAKENRRNPTAEEKMLWDALKRNKYHLKFRRQQIIGDFIVDFVCLSNKTIIEVDGGYHNSNTQKEEDLLRTKDLTKLGFTVFRFSNEEINDNVYSVVDSIFTKIFDGKD